MMWISSHVAVGGNKRADELAGDAVENDMEWNAPVRPSDFLPLSRVKLLEGWQIGWDGGEYANSIWTLVSFMPWFRRFDGDQVIISMMANHSFLKSHLGRIGIVESSMCVCSRDYDTVDHVLWCYDSVDAERLQLWMDLGLTDTEQGTPIRDILGGRDWMSLRRCCSFFRRCNLKI
jgi:hypothetical protein